MNELTVKLRLGDGGRVLRDEELIGGHGYGRGGQVNGGHL